jgi:hypothetical protein
MVSQQDVPQPHPVMDHPHGALMIGSLPDLGASTPPFRATVARESLRVGS